MEPGWPSWLRRQTHNPGFKGAEPFGVDGKVRDLKIARSNRAPGTSSFLYHQCISQYQVMVFNYRQWMLCNNR